MALVKIIQDFNAIEGWLVGEIVDITSPEVLLREGKVILADEISQTPIEEPTPQDTPPTDEASDETVTNTGKKKNG